MDHSERRLLLMLACVFVTSATVFAQSPGPSSGEITVQLIQRLDSAANPRGVSEGRSRRRPAVATLKWRKR
jgi:hypothetical protein